MANISTLVTDIYRLADGNLPSSTGEHSLEVSYNKWFEEPWVRKDKHLSFSEVGTSCLRKLWYDVNTPHHKEAIDGNLRIKFLYGDMLESLVLSLAKAAGHDVQQEQERVTYDVGNGWTISGRLDAVIDGVVVDVKSTTKFGVQKFQQGLKDDPFGYVMQVSGYAVALNNVNAGFLTIQKELGHIEYFPMRVDKGHFHESVVAATEAVESTENIMKRLAPVPQNPTSKNSKLCTACSYCGYKAVCWPEARTFLYSTGPVTLVNIVDVPRVTEVV
jgi:CRISPR/Cas system-associated exonuclease Cas4 (RecB family)